MGTLNHRIVGKCSVCGGIVSVPTLWYGVNRPPLMCESCGAVADDTANMHIVPMRQNNPPDKLNHGRKETDVTP